MADKKISALTSASTPLAGTEVLPIVQSGATVKVAISDVTAGRAVSASSFTAPTIGAGTSSALTIQSNATTGATMDTSQNIGFGTTTINGFYGSGSVTTRGVFAYSSSSTDCNAAPKGLVIRNDDTTASNLSMLAFGTMNTGATPIATAAVWSVNDARSSGFSTGSLRFGTNGGSGVISERASIGASTGDFTLASGNFVVGTSGKGIDFSATSGTGTSELLADYEEGTWTPVLNAFTIVLGGGTVTTSGTYTKVGRLVKLNCQIIAAGGATVAATSGQVSYISGAPYAPANTAGGVWVNGTTYNSNGNFNIINFNSWMFITTSWVGATNQWSLDVVFEV